MASSHLALLRFAFAIALAVFAGSATAQEDPLALLFEDYQRAAMERRDRDALRIGEEALASARVLYGERSPEAIDGLILTGTAHAALGDFAAAGRAAAQASELLDAVAPDDAVRRAELLTLLGIIAEDEGRYPEALSRQEQALALREKRFGSTSPATAQTLGNLGALAQTMGRYEQAIAYDSRVIAIVRELNGPRDPTIASLLNNLGIIYRKLGRFAESRQSYEEAREIDLERFGPDHPETSQVEANLAVLLADMAEYEQAMQIQLRVLEQRKKFYGVTDARVANTLNNIAELHRNLGHYAEAKQTHEQAYALRKRVLGATHPAVADSGANLAALCFVMGEYAEGAAYMKEALAIRRERLGPEHPAYAQTLSAASQLEYSVGRYDEAIAFDEQGLRIREKVFGPEHPDVAISLNRLGLLYSMKGDNARSEELLTRALQINRTALGADHPAVSAELNNLGVNELAMGRSALAVERFSDAARIRELRLGPTHPDTAVVLGNLGRALLADGRRAEALPVLLRAYRIAQTVDVPTLTAGVAQNLARLYADDGDVAAAVFMGKQAVNIVQRLRAGTQSLDVARQRSLLEHNRAIYDELIRWLIDQDRLAEALEVVGMLKEHEYREFVRGRDEASPDLQAGLTEREAGWQKRFMEISGRLVAIGREAASLRARQANGALGAAESARLAELERDDVVAATAFDTLVTSMVKELADRSVQDMTRERVESLGALREALNDMGGDAVLLHYIQTPNRLHIVVTTPSGQTLRTVEVDRQTLTGAIARFRAAVQDPGRDARTEGAELYRLLFSPVEADLQQAHASTVMLSLTGSLRYVPFAALYDGQRYLVERFALAVYTDAAAWNLKDRAPDQPKVWALGLTHAVPGFPALTNVRLEVEGILKTVDGEAFFDDAFTEARLKEGIARHYPMFHIATHFRFSPVSERDSYLLLGDGTRLTLAQVRYGLRFDGLDMLALSACETGASGARDDDGREIEGLGTLAQRRGAKSVLATLWPVADRSTSMLMQALYQARASKMSKAAALQAAQLHVMHSAAAAPPVDIASGRAVGVTPGASLRPSNGSRPDYSHPYHWAAFFLMGNWL